jgi:hypothetical protein
MAEMGKLASGTVARKVHEPPLSRDAVNVASEGGGKPYRMSKEGTRPVLPGQRRPESGLQRNLPDRPAESLSLTQLRMSNQIVAVI